MHLAVVALDDSHIVLVNAVVRLHILRAVPLAHIVHAPELAVDKHQRGGGRHGIRIQHRGNPLHIGVPDKGSVAVVARVAEQEPREGRDRLPPAVQRSAAEEIVVEIGVQSAALIERAFVVDTQGFHAPARRAVAADSQLDLRIADALAGRVEHFHACQSARAGRRDDAGRAEIAVKSGRSDHLLQRDGQRDNGNAIRLQLRRDEVCVGEHGGGIGSVGGVRLDDVSAGHG